VTLRGFGVQIAGPVEGFGDAAANILLSHMLVKFSLMHSHRRLFPCSTKDELLPDLARQSHQGWLSLPPNLIRPFSDACRFALTSETGEELSVRVEDVGKEDFVGTEHLLNLTGRLLEKSLSSLVLSRLMHVSCAREQTDCIGYNGGLIDSRH
jgi:hypothetical protein